MAGLIPAFFILLRTFVNMRRLIILLISLLFTSQAVNAQTAFCVDTTLIQQGYNCPNALIDYNPVCACNGETYNNICIAKNLHGIDYFNTTEGPCSDFDFYFTPNVFAYDLSYAYYSKTSGILNIFIFDTMGQIKFEYREPVQMVNMAVRDRYIDISTMDNGLYLMLLIKDGTQLVKKFYKGSPF
jgi:hypothetical protein